MADFLADMYRPWAEIASEETTSQFEGPTDELDCPYACCLGFSYQAGGGAEREYIYAVIRWMALQVGRTKKGFGPLTLPKPAPYYRHDQGDTVPVLLEEDWPAVSKGMRPFLVDSYGLPTADDLARHLAWFHLPDGTYERVAITHRGRPSDDIQEAIIQSGIERARVVLQFIRSEVARLDVLWPR